MQGSGGDLASRMIKAATKPSDGYVTADLKFEEDIAAHTEQTPGHGAKCGVPALV